MKNYQSYSDDELLTLISANDEQAFHVLYNRYWKKLLVQALLKLESAEEAEEVVQTIFVNLWRRRHSIQLRFSLATYLASIVKYEIIEHLGKQRKEAALKRGYIKDQIVEDHSTSEWLEYEHLRQEIERTVAALPEKCRLVFRLSREEGLSGKQIAASLDISPKTVEAHMNKALKLLRTSLRHLFHFF